MTDGRKRMALADAGCAGLRDLTLTLHVRRDALGACAEEFGCRSMEAARHLQA